MGTGNSSYEFKRDAAHQITVPGYPVREVSRRLAVSTHSLCKWMKLFGDPAPKKPDVENRRLKRELARGIEERDVLRKGEFIFRHWSGDNERARTSCAKPDEVRLYPGV